MYKSKKHKKVVEKALHKGFDKLSKREREQLAELLSSTYGIKMQDKKGKGSSRK